MSDLIVEKQNESILNLSLKINDANSFTLDGFAALEAALERAASKENIRALILSSEAESFSNGLNPTSVHGASVADIEKLIGYFFSVLKKVFLFPVPVIAAMNGHAIGYGAMLCLVSDFRILVDKGARVSFPELNLGISLPILVTRLLHELVGQTVTRDLLFTGLAPKPPEALELGLVDELVEKEKLMDRANQLAKKLATLPKGAVRSQKKIIRWDFGRDLEGIIAEDSKATVALLNSAEAKEGFAALVEKRRPKFD